MPQELEYSKSELILGKDDAYRKVNKETLKRLISGELDDPEETTDWRKVPSSSAGPEDELEQMHKAEKAWAPTKANDTNTIAVGKIKSTLNKLTVDNFNRLFSQLLEVLLLMLLISDAK